MQPGLGGSPVSRTALLLRFCFAPLVAATLASACAMRAPAQTLLTSASAARVRASPSTESAIVAQLPLGTELHQTGEAAGSAWIRVRLADGREGWVHASLARELPPGQRERIIEEVIRERLARERDPFDAYAELVDFIERTVPAAAATPDFAARLALYRLQALQRTVETIPFLRRNWSPALVSWVEGRQAEILYNEPGGMWMLQRDVILAEHDRHRTTPAADDIAWLAALNGLPGECEGHLACYLARADLLDGEYLRRKPHGRHAQKAVDRLRELTGSLQEQLGAGLQFDPAVDCAELMATVAALRTAVAGSGASGREQVSGTLDRFARLCPRDSR